MKTNVKINHKIEKIIFIALIICIWIIFAFHTDDADYASYHNWYRITKNTGAITNRFEIGFSLSMFLGSLIGLDFQQFIMIFSAIGLLLISISIYDYSKAPCLVLILYFIYPYFFDVVQIRNFMAEAIVFFGLRYLKEFTTKNIIFYVLFVLLSTMMHITSLFYFTYLVAYIKDYKNVVKSIILLLMFYLIFFFLAPSNITNIITGFVSNDYIEGGTTINKIIGYGVFAVFSVIILFFLKDHNETKLIDDNYKVHITECMKKIIPTIMITIAMIAISSQGYRFFRNISLIVYIVYINEGIEIKNFIIRGKAINYISTIYAISFSCFFFWRQLSWNAPLFEVVTQQIINSNLLFK